MLHFSNFVMSVASPILTYHLVTHQSTSPSWMKRHSRHRIWLRDIYPYVFCQTYKKRHQFTKNGEFEIYFVNEEGTLLSPSVRVYTETDIHKAADAFEDTFREGSDISSIDDYDGSP